jgi:hypothetical protein
VSPERRNPRRRDGGSEDQAALRRKAYRGDTTTRPHIVASSIDLSRRRLNLTFSLGAGRFENAEVRWLLIDPAPVVHTTAKDKATDDRLQDEVFRLLDVFDAIRHYIAWAEALHAFKAERDEEDEEVTGWSRRWSA